MRDKQIQKSFWKDRYKNLIVYTKVEMYIKNWKTFASELD